MVAFESVAPLVYTINMKHACVISSVVQCEALHLFLVMMTKYFDLSSYTVD